MSFFKKDIVSSVEYTSNNTCDPIISYNIENHIGHWERRIHPLCVWTVLAHGPGWWPIETRDSVWLVGGGDGRWWWWRKRGETTLGFGTCHVNNPCSSCLLPSFAFLCGHSWNPFERTFVIIVLYTFTPFVQREVRWAINLRYIKKFEIYLIFLQTGSRLHAQWTRCAFAIRCTRDSNSAQIAWPRCSVHFHGSRKWNGLGKRACGEEDKEFWKCNL
jgi:hypothetical protein